MHKNNTKIAASAALIYEAVLIYTLASGAMNRDFRVLKLAATASLLVVLPFLLLFAAHKKNILLPPGFLIVSSTFSFAALYIGEINYFYNRFWWYDLLLHLVFGCYASLVFLYGSITIIQRRQNTSSGRFALLKSVSSFCFALSMGTLWELFEFTGDYLFNTGMVKGGLEDSSTDLLILVFSALITCVYIYRKSKNSTIP